VRDVIIINNLVNTEIVSLKKVRVHNRQKQVG